MRFAWDDAAPGFEQAYRALLGGGYQRGQADQLKYESAVAKALADVDQSRASAAANTALASQRDAETAILTGRPDLVRELAALESGRTPQQIEAFRTSFNQGAPTAPYTPEARSAITRALISRLPMLGMDKWGADDIAKARGTYGDQFRLEDVQAGRVPLERYHAERFAEKGGARYGVDEGMPIDQLGGIGATPTPVGNSMITRNLAAASRSNAGAVAEGYKLVEGVDDEGNPAFEFVQIKGNRKGEKPATTLKPRSRRDVQQADARSAYTADYEFPGESDPSLDEYTAMRTKGYNPRVDFKRLLKEAQDAIKRGADRNAVAARLKDDYGINPARLK